jgi:hypothetical protein
MTIQNYISSNKVRRSTPHSLPNTFIVKGIARVNEENQHKLKFSLFCRMNMRNTKIPT